MCGQSFSGSGFAECGQSFSGSEERTSLHSAQWDSRGYMGANARTPTCNARTRVGDTAECMRVCASHMRTKHVHACHAVPPHTHLFDDVHDAVRVHSAIDVLGQLRELGGEQSACVVSIEHVRAGMYHTTTHVVLCAEK